MPPSKFREVALSTIASRPLCTEKFLHINPDISNICFIFAETKGIKPRAKVKEMDTKILEFVTYCISKLSHVLNMSQREVYRRLKQSGILYGYIVPSYDVLHTFGSRYLMEDLTDYMREKGVLSK